MENNKIKDKIDELVESLNRASKAYYNGADEIMPQPQAQTFWLDVAGTTRSQRHQAKVNS